MLLFFHFSVEIGNRKFSSALTMGNDGHVTDIGSPVHEFTDLGDGKAVVISGQVSSGPGRKRERNTKQTSEIKNVLHHFDVAVVKGVFL